MKIHGIGDKCLWEEMIRDNSWEEIEGVGLKGEYRSYTEYVVVSFVENS